MSEATRGLLYRAFLLITLLFASSGLATANTSIHRYRGK
jgi:hypothetical protein